MPPPPERGRSDSNPPPSTSTSQMKTHIVDAEPRATRRKGVFTVSGGLDAGRVLALPREDVVSLGRASECTYPFDDVGLSREHAQVMCIGSEYVFKDAGSTNGSFINEVRVTKVLQLRNGDRVRLGSNLTLRFALVDDQEEEALVGIYEAAVRDGLTGVFNRKHLEERLAAELEAARRHGTSLSVILLDIDHFKYVNDTYGHLAGDAVLKNVAALVGQGIRQEDVIGRYGGEEFVIVCRGAAVVDAVALAERLRWAIWNALTPFESHQIRVTVSAGVASLLCVAEPTRSGLLGMADTRLYKAKQAGRNRVVGSD
jgi:two-component system cell cycle response regulator